MKKITAICGAQGSGLSTLATSMTNDKDHVVRITGLKDIKNVPPDTTVLIIDELTMKDLPTLKFWHSKKQWTFKPPKSKIFVKFDPPKIIVTTQMSPVRFVEMRRFEVITTGKTN